MEPRREITLLERIARGDAAAVPLFVERYTPLVWNLARRQLGSHVAEDLVQEVFLALWQGAERFDANLSSEANFVLTVARRRIIDLRRRAGRAPRTEEIEEATDPSDALAPVDLSDEARRAEAALDELAPAQREVLRLALVEGLTHSEVAERLALPLGTVKSHVRRGLERVRARVLGAPPAPEGRT